MSLTILPLDLTVSRKRKTEVQEGPKKKWLKREEEEKERQAGAAREMIEEEEEKYQLQTYEDENSKWYGEDIEEVPEATNFEEVCTCEEFEAMQKYYLEEDYVDYNYSLQGSEIKEDEILVVKSGYEDDAHVTDEEVVIVTCISRSPKKSRRRLF